MSNYKKQKKRWQADVNEAKNREYDFRTVSSLPVDLLYMPETESEDYIEKLGFPGQYPFTRGVHPNMYRGKLWTMRQFAGFGTPQDTNERYHFLLSQGQTGLSVAFDMPTLMGYDPGHDFALGEVGRCGVNVASLKDMEILFNKIDLGKISVSQTINGPAVILLAFYIALADNKMYRKNNYGAHYKMIF